MYNLFGIITELENLMEFINNLRIEHFLSIFQNVILPIASPFGTNTQVENFDSIVSC